MPAPGGRDRRNRGMKALLIPVDEPPREVDLPSGGGTRFMNSLAALTGADSIERLWITTRWEAWLDENGRAAGKQVNMAATHLTQSFGWESPLQGTVVIVGLDEDGEPAALSSGQAAAILEKVRAAAA